MVPVPQNTPSSLSRWRPQILLYIVAINCLLHVVYLKPISWSVLPLNRQQEEDEEWRDFVQDYYNRFKRQPPNGMGTWIQHAQQHQCETRNYYDALDQDLEYFRQLQQQHQHHQQQQTHSNSSSSSSSSFFQWDKVFSEAGEMTNHYMAFSLENHKLTLVEYKSLPGHDWQRKPILRLIRKLMRPVIQHSPPLRSKFVFNLHDTAKIASAHAKYPLFSVCKMDYYTDNHAPPPPLPSSKNTTTTTTRFNITYNSGGDEDFVASKDLLVPWWFSLRFQSTKLWFWPLLNSGLPFRFRRNAITWRGSTTSAWETGPRFQLVRRFGGTKVHKLRSDNNSNSNNNITTTNVDADFAFIRIVQHEHFPPLTPGYRFARHMFYWQMQLRKYILDVDGNGFTSRFPGLLRSGSLVFKSTRYREWFHGILKPYEDYIPVNYDLTDLVEKVTWAQDNPTIAQQIVQHSKRNVESHMRVEDMQCYMYRLMLEYQTLFEQQ